MTPEHGAQPEDEPVAEIISPEDLIKTLEYLCEVRKRIGFIHASTVPPHKETIEGRYGEDTAAVVAGADDNIAHFGSAARQSYAKAVGRELSAETGRFTDPAVEESFVNFFGQFTGTDHEKDRVRLRRDLKRGPLTSRQGKHRPI